MDPREMPHTFGTPLTANEYATWLAAAEDDADRAYDLKRDRQMAEEMDAVAAAHAVLGLPPPYAPVDSDEPF